MAINYETRWNYEKSQNSTRSELSDLSKEIRWNLAKNSNDSNGESNENRDRLSEQEKTAYLKLNKKYDSIFRALKNYSLTYNDVRKFKKSGMSYVEKYHNSLVVYSKKNEYKQIWLTKYLENNNERPKIFTADIRWVETREKLSVEQYEVMLNKIQKIIDNQKGYVINQSKKDEAKKQKEVDDIINSI